MTSREVTLRVHTVGFYDTILEPDHETKSVLQPRPPVFGRLGPFPANQKKGDPGHQIKTLSELCPSGCYTGGVGERRNPL